jgi:hypothetical protein
MAQVDQEVQAWEVSVAFSPVAEIKEVIRKGL